MNFLENQSLKLYNTFGIDVKAKYFTEAKSIEDLQDILTYHKKELNNLPLLLLGGGSNILFTDDFDGLVIKVNLKGISNEVINNNQVIVTSQAGENWHQFVLFCIENNFGGLENLSLIPGNVGTSPMQNIGAYGVEIKDVFHQCKALNIETLKIETFDKDACEFGYRESIFKRKVKNQYILLEVSFILTTTDHKIKTEYGAITDELAKLDIQQPSIKDVSNAVINIRQSKLPDPKVTGNAGSFFKNPSIPKSNFDALKLKHQNIPGYPNGDLIKVPAGWLIEQAGWKGKQIDNVASNQLQALVIINATGKATGKEVFDFSSLIINDIQEKFGITLEREVNII